MKYDVANDDFLRIVFDQKPVLENQQGAAQIADNLQNAVRYLKG